MAVRRKKKIVPKTHTFEEVRAGAPEIPGDTCPYINLVQESISTLERKNSDISKQSQIAVELESEKAHFNQNSNSQIKDVSTRFAHL